MTDEMWMRQETVFKMFIEFALRNYEKQWSKTTLLVLQYKCFFGLGLPDSMSWLLSVNMVQWLQNPGNGLACKLNWNAWKEQNEFRVTSL